MCAIAVLVPAKAAVTMPAETLHATLTIDLLPAARGMAFHHALTRFVMIDGRMVTPWRLNDGLMAVPWRLNDRLVAMRSAGNGAVCISVI